MSTFAFTIPTHTTTFPIPGGGFYQSDSLGLTPTLDPDNILIAGGSVVQPGYNSPPSPSGYIINPTNNNKTVNYTISLTITTFLNFQGFQVELFVGTRSGGGIFPTGSNSILIENNQGTFTNSYTFSGSINVNAFGRVYFYVSTFGGDYTIDATVTGELVGQQTTVGSSNGVQFFCDISPDCVLPYNQNRIICAELQFVQCFAGDCAVLTTDNGLIICSENDSWNCNLCANDLPYNSPVVIGDSLYFQFQQQDLLNGNSPTLDGGGLWGNGYGWDEFGLVQGYIRDCCTGQRLQKPGVGGDAVVTDYSSNYFVGIFEGTNYSNTSNSYTNIQQIKIETGQLYTDIAAQFSGNCFYFEWVFYPNDLAYTYQLFSEPFEFVTCQDTMMLEGTTSIKDCFNLFYGEPGCVVVNNPITIGPITINNYQKECLYYIGTGLFPYTQFYRVRGSFEQTSFEITKDLVGTKLRSTSIDLTENWLLRTDRLPQRAAKLVASILASQNVYIDNKEYVVDGELPKNNEIGNQWFIDANLRKVTCSKNYSCN
jgi:hypothetical protein